MATDSAGVEAVPQTFVLPHVKEGENNREGMQAEGWREGGEL